jgi:hypothetical protein
VSGAGRIAEFVDRVGVGEIAQANQLANSLPPVQLQLGRPVGEPSTSVSPSPQRRPAYALPHPEIG